MIPQVLPHAWQVVHHRYANALELRGRTHTGQQEHMGRANGTTAHDDLLALKCEALTTAFDLHAHGALALKQEAPHHDIALDGQVHPVPGRSQVSQGHADAYPINSIAR